MRHTVQLHEGALFPLADEHRGSRILCLNSNCARIPVRKSRFGFHFGEGQKSAAVSSNSHFGKIALQRKRNTSDLLNHLSDSVRFRKHSNQSKRGRGCRPCPTLCETLVGHPVSAWESPGWRNRSRCPYLVSRPSGKAKEKKKCVGFVCTERAANDA